MPSGRRQNSSRPLGTGLSATRRPDPPTRCGATVARQRPQPSARAHYRFPTHRFSVPGRNRLRPSHGRPDH